MPTDSRDLFDLTGKVAAVTGSSRGIGRAIALGLARAGADVALLQRPTGDTGLLDEIRSLGRRAEVIGCDVSDNDQVRSAVPAVLERLGRIDILVPVAGVQHREPATDFAEDAWDHVLQVNLKSVWLLAQAAGRAMVAQGSGAIILIASVTTFQGGYTVPAYAAAKGAVGQLTKALANEWASRGVNVNALVPGYVATDMNAALLADETRLRQISERIPAGRWATPDDFVGPAVFLASDAAGYVHGHLLAVDGGWLGR